MTEMVLDCPYCDLKAGFKFVAEDPVTVPLDTRDKWTTLYICRNCGEAVIVRLKSPGPKPSSCPSDPRRSNFEIEDVYPKPQKITAPDHVPKEIEQDYKEAMGSLRLKSCNSAGMMFRKVMEDATAHLAPKGIDFKKKTLYDRIDILGEKHEITPAMQDWAHLVRVFGNEAAHIRIHGPEAKEAQKFTELFLIYAFTMPKRVELARAEYESRDTSTDS